MASNYEKPPVFARDRTWKESDLKSVEKAKFTGPHGAKEEVYKYGGDMGIEFLVSKSIADFEAAATRLDWSWAECFNQFPRVLEGAARTAWEEVMSQFPDLADAEEAGFRAAIASLIKKLLNNNTPRDQQWIYLAPGGDKSFLRDIMTAPTAHLRRFNEMVRISKLLPEGNIPDPSPRLQVQWLYMSYHRNDRSQYVLSGKVLDDESLETLTAYFQAIHDQKVSDGTLQRQQQQSTKRDERRDNYKSRSDSRHSSSRGKTYERRHDDRRDRGYDRDRGRERSRDTSRRGYDSHRSRDSGHRSRTSSSSSAKTKQQPIADPCPKHSTDGQPARHTWAECSQNPANAASSSSRDRRGHDSHHRGHDSHHVEVRTPSPSRSRSRSVSPWSDNSRHDRSVSPSDRSSASVDNYGVFAEPMKPPAEDRVGRRSSRVERRRKRKYAGYKSSRDPIPRKHYATYDDDVDGAADSYAVDDNVRDENNPLDM